MDLTRRYIMTLSAAAAATAVSARIASAQAISFTPSPIYPDPAVQVLDPSFAKYRVASSSLEQVATGARWLEGPVYFADGKYLLVSDIPNNRVMKYDETNETWSVFDANSNYANGHARDRQGRLLACEHLTRRVTRTEHDGSITVLADNYKGKKLNSRTTSSASRTARSGSPTPHSASAASGMVKRRRLNCRIRSTASRLTASSTSSPTS